MSSSDSPERRRSRQDQRSTSPGVSGRDAAGAPREVPRGDAAGTSGSSRRVPGGPARTTDFGSFVSSTARSSADRFKTTGGQGVTPRPSSGGSRTPPGPSTSDPDTTVTRVTRSAPQRTERPRRYWRDAVAQSPGGEENVTAASPRTSADTPPAPRGIRLARRDETEAGGGILSGGAIPSRTLLGIIGGVIVLISLLVFALNQNGGNSTNNAGLTPTSSVESVLNPVDGTDTGASSTPGTDETAPPDDDTVVPDSDVTDPTSEDPPEPTDEAEEPRRGGDNQRDRPTETPETSVDTSRA